MVLLKVRVLAKYTLAKRTPYVNGLCIVFPRVAFKTKTTCTCISSTCIIIPTCRYMHHLHQLIIQGTYMYMYMSSFLSSFYFCAPCHSMQNDCSWYTLGVVTHGQPNTHCHVVGCMKHLFLG